MLALFRSFSCSLPSLKCGVVCLQKKLEEAEQARKDAEDEITLERIGVYAVCECEFCLVRSAQSMHVARPDITFAVLPRD
jgi:hypothetical protein